jgi:hypothetical protein
MATVCSENSEINKNFFECKCCDYKCYKKQHVDQHFNTIKHKNKIGNNVANIGNGTVCNICVCGKKYTDRTGLWKHKKKCDYKPAHDKSNQKPLEDQAEKTADNQDLIAFLIKQNGELQKQILDVCKNSNSGNNNTINSHNKTFNLQVFLNEDCKDAMNITEFVNSIQLQLSDLEHVGQVGYVEGISNIIIKNLKALDVTKRPVHCTDPKRETIYIKDGDVWEKDEDDNKKLRKMIKSVAFRNCKNTRLFKEKYPECMDGDSKYSDIYNKIIIEVMGGDPKSNDIEKQNKIIRKIAKVMTIDKSNPLL